MSDDEVEDTSDKFVDTTVTMADLRKDDEHWQPLSSDMKLQLQEIIRSHVPYFSDKPLMNCGTTSLEEFTASFLAQPKLAYGWSLDMDAALFCEFAYEGFLSTSIELPFGGDVPIQILFPWSDPVRNSLDFADVHISRQVRKRAKRYSMTVDTAYDEVILGCVHQHGEGWLYRGLRWLLRGLHRNSYQGSMMINVGVHSFELWDSDGQLVAGDLGYTVGGVYTSMTGFRRQSTQGAGELQLVLTAALLQKMGYDWWDLGMVMKYKGKLGARTVNRKEFIERLHRDRDKSTAFHHDHIAGDLLLRHFRECISSNVKSVEP